MEAIIETGIAELAEWHRKKWNMKLYNSEDIEEYGRNEFIGGKAEAFEESLKIIRKYLKIPSSS